MWYYWYFYLKKLKGTLHFVLILALPVDKGGGVSPNIRLHVPSASLLCCKETTSSGGERTAAPEMDIQVAAEAARIQPQQTPAPFPTRCQALRITIRK